MVIELERRAHFRILQLGEFGVVDDHEGVVGIDIENVALLHLRAAEQAGVVKPHDVDRLIGAVRQLHLRTANKKRHCITDSVHTQYGIEQVIR